MKKILPLIALALLTTACGGGKGTVLNRYTPPDETTVIDTAPLQVPPNFDLRPPREGDERAEHLLKPQQNNTNLGEDSWLLQDKRIDPTARETLQDPSKIEPQTNQDAPKTEKSGWLNNLWGSKTEEPK